MPVISMLRGPSTDRIASRLLVAAPRIDEEVSAVPNPVSHSLVKSLRTVPDFAALDDRMLLAIVGASINLFWRAGSTIFEKGTPSEALYIVLSGEVRIFDVLDGKEAEVARIGPTASFGELSLLLHTVHTKTAQALQDTELMVVPEASMLELLAANPELAEQYRLRIEERLPVRGQVSP
jgi:CRP/FNR family cyclic AMP-dependent transcriptional regulator